MNYEEAKEHSRSIPWKTQECPKGCNMNISTEQLKNLIMKYDYDNGCYPESEYEGLSIYSFICKELGIECDLEEYDRPGQKYAKFLKETFEVNK